MTIRRRLGISFFVILTLFATSQAFYLWNARLQTRTMHALDHALTRQILIASLRHELDNLHKHFAILSLSEGEPEPDTEVHRLFKDKIDLLTRQIVQLKALTEPDRRASVNEVEEVYSKLADAWMSFVEYGGVRGVEQAWALAYVIRAQPLSDRLLTELIPRLQEDERQRVREAEAEFQAVTRRTARISIAIFVLSSLLAAAVAYLLTRHLTHGLTELKSEAALIGRLTLDHRIPIRSQDEIADLARSFNDMADKLLVGRTQLMDANRELERHTEEIEKERQRAESLLRNILPGPVADELETQGAVKPRYFEDVTILFTDFVGFTLSTQELAAEEVILVLHDYFTAFDQVVARYRLEKLKTIGDSYMCAGGLPTHNPAHPVDTVLAALEMLAMVAERDRLESSPGWGIRIGMHTGPVVAGVVGIQKFAFDVWGDTVNYASRMETSGVPNRINISVGSYVRVKDFFECEYRGKVLTKDRKESDMYFVSGILPSLIDDPTQIPPPAFLHRYRAYFHKDPPAFPALLLKAQRAPGPLFSKLVAVDVKLPTTDSGVPQTRS